MSDNTSTLLLAAAAAAGYYMYTKKIGIFAPSSSPAPLAPMGSSAMLTPLDGQPQPSGYTASSGGVPATVPPPVISQAPNYYELPTYQTPIITTNVEGGVTNWQGATTYAAQLQVVLNGKGLATPAGYADIYRCMSNVSGGSSMSADAWGRILGNCIGGSAVPGAMVTGSYDTSAMPLDSYWRFISPYGVPVTSFAGLAV